MCKSDKTKKVTIPNTTEGTLPIPPEEVSSGMQHVEASCALISAQSSSVNPSEFVLIVNSTSTQFSSSISVVPANESIVNVGESAS